MSRFQHGPIVTAANKLEAALLKATYDLEHEVQARRLRRLERIKSQPQLTAISADGPMLWP